MKSRRRNLRWVDLNMSELELDKLILHFAQSNKAEGKSPKTIDWYTEMLTGFSKFIIVTDRRAQKNFSKPLGQPLKGLSHKAHQRLLHSYP